MNKERNKLQYEMMNELDVNDVLRDRRDRYINVLQHELVVAKNIISRPFILGKISKHLASEKKDVYYYQKIENRKDEEQPSGLDEEQ